MLDALAIERVTVVGHSVGGSVAAMFTAGHPDRVERSVFIGHGMAMDPMQWVPFVPGLGEFEMARMAISSDVVSDAHRRRLSAADEIRGTPAALLTYVRRHYAIDGPRLVLGSYEDIATPVLQMHGTGDASVPIEAARRITPRLRDARFVAVEGGSHDVHIDAPDQLVADIEGFELETASPEPKDTRKKLRSLARREGLLVPLRGPACPDASRPGSEPPTPRFEGGVGEPERALERQELAISCSLVTS